MTKSTPLKNESARLRKQGLSLLDIARQLNVSKSTVRNWTRNTRVSQKSKNILKDRYIREATARIMHIQDIKRKSIDNKRHTLQKEGVRDLKDLKDPLFFLGLGLYWGEGNKNKTNEVGIVNSDPRILRVSIMWFIKYYQVNQNELKFRLTINEDYRNRENEFASYWIKELNLNSNQFTKTSFAKAKHKRIYSSDSYRGTLRIQILKPLRLRERIISSINSFESFINSLEK